MTSHWGILRCAAPLKVDCVIESMCSLADHTNSACMLNIHTDQAQALCMHGVFLPFQSDQASAASATMQAHCLQVYMLSNLLQRQKYKCDLEH